MSQIDNTEVPPIVRQGELIESIARSLFAATPPGFAGSYRARMLRPVMEDEFVFDPGGASQRQISAPDSIIDTVLELRKIMYRNGAGTWYSAEVLVSAAGAVDASFDYDNEPQWHAPIDPTSYVQDLEKFPRDEASRPAWLKQRLKEAFQA